MTSSLCKRRTVRPCLCAWTGLGEGGGVGSWLVVDEGGNGGGGGGGDGGEGSNSGTGDSNQRHWTKTGDARVQSCEVAMDCLFLTTRENAHGLFFSYYFTVSIVPKLKKLVQATSSSLTWKFAFSFW